MQTSTPYLYLQSVKLIYNSPLFEPTMKEGYIETSILKLKFRKKIDPSQKSVLPTALFSSFFMKCLSNALTDSS